MIDMLTYSYLIIHNNQELFVLVDSLLSFLNIQLFKICFFIYLMNIELIIKDGFFFFVISLEYFSIYPKDTSKIINVTLETNKIKQKIFYLLPFWLYVVYQSILFLIFLIVPWKNGSTTRKRQEAHIHPNGKKKFFFLYFFFFYIL